MVKGALTIPLQLVLSFCWYTTTKHELRTMFSVFSTGCQQLFHQLFATPSSTQRFD
jgi:hypothetical protein